MKPIPQDIIGKRLETVLIRESEDGRPPLAQLFLCFDDGTSVEFWADGDIHPSGGLDKDTAADIERKARPGTVTIAKAQSEAGNERSFSMEESLRLVSALMHVQNEIIYVLEQLTQNYMAEGRRGIADVRTALVSDAIPSYIGQPIARACEEAEAMIFGAYRDPEGCARLLGNHRKRLANEIAFRTGDPLPYTEQYFPTYTSASNAPLT